MFPFCLVYEMRFSKIIYELQINESKNFKLSDWFYVLLIGEIGWPVINDNRFN